MKKIENQLIKIEIIIKKYYTIMFIIIIHKIEPVKTF